MNYQIRLGLATLLSLLPSCGEKEPPAGSSPSIPTAPIPAKAVTEFSGDMAMEHVVAINEFGPRPAESEGYQKSLAYLEKALNKLGWKTSRQEFPSTTPLGKVNFTNLLARYSPDSEPDWSLSPPYLLGGHLDSKRYSDIVFLGANDGGSSTGVMVEVARVLSQHGNAARQVELVFFDGEEAMLKNIDPKRDGLYGSRYFAGHLKSRKNKPYAGIIIDLVGDAKVPLQIGLDSHKNLHSHARVAARSLGLEKVVVDAAGGIIDDHIPLINNANVPCLHLIGDFQKMPYWHTKD
ncbi:M28 family peptidase, partial [Akkermansiaceae bacterium]|nr:M28 family peptidase [Akkermansiaceae bacterium]